MTSIYMPDEVISMFPADLSQKLLSLGAKECSFAFSCGVILDPTGKTHDGNQVKYIDLSLHVNMIG